jgi:hypothetical protein
LGLSMYATSTAHLISLNIITNNVRLSVQTMIILRVSQFLLFRNFSLLQKVQTDDGARQAS